MAAASKLGIIGDVHAEHRRLTLTLDYLRNEGINQIACTGDLSDGIGDLDETVEILLDHNVASDITRGFGDQFSEAWKQALVDTLVVKLRYRLGN